MLLAIDSGNTNTVFAVFDKDGKLGGEWRSSTDAKRTADEFGMWLTQLMEMQGVAPADIKAAILANVVPPTLFSLKTLCRKYFGCDPLVVGEAGVDLGIGVLVERPDEVGADRLANAVAAQESYGGPLIVLDFGTSTNFDVVDKDGNYVGGVIAPGVNLSLEALHMAAARLPRVAIEKPDHIIGKGTVEAMKSGIFWGYIGLIEGLVGGIRDELGYDMVVISTGGLAPLFSADTGCINHTDPDLTLRGLYSIHRLNAKA